MIDRTEKPERYFRRSSFSAVEVFEGVQREKEFNWFPSGSSPQPKKRELSQKKSSMYLLRIEETEHDTKPLIAALSSGPDRAGRGARGEAERVIKTECLASLDILLSNEKARE